MSETSTLISCTVALWRSLVGLQRFPSRTLIPVETVLDYLKVLDGR